MARFEASSDARFLTQALAKVEPGQLVTYVELSAAIGRDVRTHAGAQLQTAIRTQLAEGRVFEAIAGSGYRLLTSGEIVKTQAAKGFQRIGRMARRTAKKVGAAKFEELTNSEKVAHNAQLSMLGALGHLSKPRALETLEKHVTQNSAELPIGDTLKLMIS